MSRLTSAAAESGQANHSRVPGEGGVNLPEGHTTGLTSGNDTTLPQGANGDGRRSGRTVTQR